jgi:prepilin-type N-terminal cleavage/methylation domain-containing protein
MNASSRNTARGFSLVEMLVVIGIIAILIGMILPALSGAQDRGRKNRETNYLRQVGTAWAMYATNNNEAAVPGYIDENVQSRWRTRVRFPIEPGTFPDDPDTDVSEMVGGTWVWRLLPYLDFSYNTVLGYHDASERTPHAMVRDRDFVAEFPGFGYNGLYIGGRWSIWPTPTPGGDDLGAGGRPQFYFANVREAPSSPGFGLDGPRVNVVARSVAQIRRTSEVVVFCSSSRFQNPIVVRNFADVERGYHFVTPPIVADEIQWGYTEDDGGGGSAGEVAVGAGDPRHIRTVAAPALAPVGRYNGVVPILRADLSIETNLPGALVDQRLWIDAAQTRDFRHTFSDHSPAMNESDFSQFP